MTIHRRSPPAESLDAMRRSLEPSPKGKATASIASTLQRKPDLSTPNALEIFTLGLDRFLDDSALDHAVTVGWMYLLDQQSRPTAAEVYYQRDGSLHKMGAINRGVVTDKIASAVDTLDRFDADGDYDLRLLRIPALQHSFVWLKDSGGKDRFVSVSAMTELVPELTPLSWPHIQQALRKQAEARITAEAPNKRHRDPLD